ncbi:hypothetical protein M422DRAFT_242976 [Sphaerobolus stellatus SS14]|nr:hypothetical protein M422DRAFT_242976 [Sphaerobolus stellatus SS14]
MDNSKYGLGIDNIVSYELVTPNAQILTVTAQSRPDIFFGLRLRRSICNLGYGCAHMPSIKGGGNNFGIVTTFVLKAHPQGQVYGGMLFYIGDIPAIRQAIQGFDANNNDPNALILPSYVYKGGTLVAGIILFHDGPTPPKGTFDAFLAVPCAVETDVKARSFPDFVQSIKSRVASHTIPIIRYTQRIVDAIVNQTMLLGTSGLINNSNPNAFVALSIEPFNSDLYDHSTVGVYPHSPAHPWTPFQILIGYTDPTADNVTLAVARTAAAAIQQVAIEEGYFSPAAILYSNYAQKGTDLKLLFGDNLPLLPLQAKYDSHDLLSLTGGWRF